MDEGWCTSSMKLLRCRPTRSMWKRERVVWAMIGKKGFWAEHVSHISKWRCWLTAGHGDRVDENDANCDDDWLQMVCQTYLRLSSIRRWMPSISINETSLRTKRACVCVCVPGASRKSATTVHPNEEKREQQQKRGISNSDSERKQLDGIALRWKCISCFIKESIDQCETTNFVVCASDASLSTLPIANYRSSSSANSFRFYCFHSNFICFVHSFAFAQYYSLQLIYSSVEVRAWMKSSKSNAMHIVAYGWSRFSIFYDIKSPFLATACIALSVTVHIDTRKRQLLSIWSDCVCVTVAVVALVCAFVWRDGRLKHWLFCHYSF